MCTIEPFGVSSVYIGKGHNYVISSCSFIITMNSGMYTQAPTPGASGKFANSEKLPSPRSGYGCREISDLWSAPVQSITILENSQLSSASQLRRSHPVNPLHSPIALAQSWDCINVLHNPEIAQSYCTVSRLAAQSRDWYAILGFWECTVRSRDCANS